MKFDLVDVFAEEALAGNQLAVVHDAGHLTTEKMQAIALETNFSETTFVLSQTEDRARVRIFTPIQELPFAGHPTLGTASVLANGRDHFTLELEVGDVRVDFADGIAWMAPPAVTLDAPEALDTVAGWLGLEVKDLDSRFTPQRGDVGIEFFFVGLESLETLKRVRPSLEQLNALPSFALFVFCAEGYPGGADYAARMFFEAGGLREDPATGSANSIFAAYLAQFRGATYTATVDQGVEMNRPSRIYLDVREGAVRVGGKVQAVASGIWNLSQTNIRPLR